MFPRCKIKNDKVGVICSRRCDKKEIHTKFRQNLTVQETSREINNVNEIIIFKCNLGFKL
jgi:hypothetical protein